MKALQILPSLEVGGVERGVLDLARAMKKEGHECVVISSGGELVQELQKMGVKHYTLPVHQKSLFSLFLVPKIADIIRRERIDIIHARSRVPGWLGWMAARRTAKPFVTTCHGYYSNHVLSRVMGWGKRVIVISRAIGRHMMDDFGVPSEKIRLIHRGIDLSQFPFSNRRLEAKQPVLRIINVGRFSPIKGQVEFLRAVHLLRRRLPSIEVWLVGAEVKGKTKYTQRILQTIQQLGLERCVKLLGTRRDVAELIAQTDLLVLSTLVPEAFGRVIIEAGAVGTPVIATRVGGVLDVIDPGENGIFVPAGDIPAMAEAIYESLTDREKAKNLALNLRRKIESQFTLKALTEQTMAVYREVEREKKILIMKLGATGDLILGTPSFRMIRERFSQASISLLVDKKLAGLVASCPYLNETIPVNREKLDQPSYLFKLAKSIRREGYDLCVDLQNSKWTHLLAALSGIPERYGFYRGLFGFLVNRPDRSFYVTDSPVKHQFRILMKIGVKKLDETLELWPDPVAENRVREWLSPNGSPAPAKTVGLVIGASPKWPTKRWPLENFRELSGNLIKKHNCRVVLLGAEEDAEAAEGFANGSSSHLINLVGKTSLEDLVSLVKSLDVLVTGDTAPLHIAAAMKTRIVSIFGPTDSKRHMPPANKAVVLTRHLPCQPCYKGECRNEEKLACLKKISVEEVLQAVQKQLTS
ncbi:MAG TPA: lipopolysaccharide heptosyltransferase II [bacterium]|nr:lipopolysaccharide heptosyltransferase II [bacterium]